MSSARQSDLDKLHRAYIAELAAQLKGTTDAEGNRVPPTAALLAVVGRTLFSSGTKATNDSPAMTTLRTAYADALPFKVDDMPLKPF